MLKKPFYCIYCILLLLYIIIGIVHADIDKCNADALECLQDFSTTNTVVVTTSSSFSFGELSSTVTEATSTDILSDFHEAKLVKPRTDPNNPTEQIAPVTEDEPSFQDNINQDHDLGSSGEGMPIGTVNGEDTTRPISALSNVEAGVLSACGILVVAGVAVGIFVWKNTTRRRNIRRNHELPMAVKDIEHNDRDDNSDITTDIHSIKKYDGVMLRQSSFKSINVINLPLPAFDRDDFYTNWQRRTNTDDNHFEYEPKQKSPMKTIVISEKKQQGQKETVVPETTNITFQIPSLEHTIFISEPKVEEVVAKKKDQLEKEDYIENQLRNSVYGPMFQDRSPQIEANTTATRPSALDPAYDPTALTYPLQKFLQQQTPDLQLSPMQISINLGSDDGEEEEDKAGKATFLSPAAQQQQEIRTSNEIMKGESSTRNLSHQLNKLLKPTIEHNTMVEINLDDTTELPLSLAAAAVQKFDKNTEMSLENLERAYQGLEQEHKTRYLQNEKGKGPAQLFIEDYKEKYLAKHGKPFMSPLYLPNDQYVPLRDAAGPYLVSRAEILADPKRRLGQDEIALWEESCRRKELKRLSYEMWDEQILREKIEEYDRKHIACYYGHPEDEDEEDFNTEQAVPTQAASAQAQASPVSQAQAQPPAQTQTPPPPPPPPPQA